jgi:hypothetical protein
MDIPLRALQDKTFGLKNKKGKAQQKFIEQVQKGSGIRQVRPATPPPPVCQ